jgi:hypothetical protein
MSPFFSPVAVQNYYEYNIYNGHNSRGGLFMKTALLAIGCEYLLKKYWGIDIINFIYYFYILFM